MYGYDDKLRPEKANLVIRRRYIDHLANDLGFQRRADGGVNVVISEYDLHGPGMELLKRIKQQYAVKFVERQARKVGTRVKQERRQDGTIVMRLVR